MGPLSAGPLPSGAVAAPTSSRRARPLLAAVALVVIALGAGACDPGRPPAATVEGIEIPASRVDDVLAGIIEADEDLREQIEGAGEDTYTSESASQVLNLLVVRAVMADAARERGVRPTDEDRSEARTDLEEFFGGTGDAEERGKAIVDKIPEGTRRWLLRLAAEGKALQRDLVGEGSPDDAAREYYEANPDLFATICLDLLVVAEADLAPVQGRLAAGEDFRTLSEEVSVDPTVNESPERTNCASVSQLQQGLGADAFAQVQAAGDGGVAGPFQYDDQGNVVLVRASAGPVQPYEAVAEELAQQIPATGEAELQAFLAEALPGAEVRIDPRFGSWNGKQGEVRPPPGGASEPADVAETTAPGAASDPSTTEPAATDATAPR